MRCDTGLKCYGPDLAGSDGVCMNASSLANKGEKCCIFCHTAPPCDTGLRCNCGDPNDEGVCTDPWFLVGAGDAEKSPVVCSACNSNLDQSHWIVVADILFTVASMPPLVVLM